MKTQAKQNYDRQVVATALVIGLMFIPQFAMAAGGNPIQGMLDGVIGFLNNGVIRSLAVLAIMAMGVAAYLGKISWELAMKIGAGIILTVGAGALADQFMGYAA